MFCYEEVKVKVETYSLLFKFASYLENFEDFRKEFTERDTIDTLITEVFS
jgi:hypothetical protein